MVSFGFPDSTAVVTSRRRDCTSRSFVFEQYKTILPCVLVKTTIVFLFGLVSVLAFSARRMALVMRLTPHPYGAHYQRLHRRKPPMVPVLYRAIFSASHRPLPHCGSHYHYPLRHLMIYYEAAYLTRLTAGSLAPYMCESQMCWWRREFLRRAGNRRTRTVPTPQQQNAHKKTGNDYGPIGFGPTARCSYALPTTRRSLRHAAAASLPASWVLRIALWFNRSPTPWGVSTA